MFIVLRWHHCNFARFTNKVWVFLAARAANPFQHLRNQMCSSGSGTTSVTTEGLILHSLSTSETGKKTQTKKRAEKAWCFGGSFFPFWKWNTKSCYSLSLLSNLAGLILAKQWRCWDCIPWCFKARDFTPCPYSSPWPSHPDSNSLGQSLGVGKGRGLFTLDNFKHL